MLVGPDLRQAVVVDDHGPGVVAEGGGALAEDGGVVGAHAQGQVPRRQLQDLEGVPLGAVVVLVVVPPLPLPADPLAQQGEPLHLGLPGGHDLLQAVLLPQVAHARVVGVGVVEGVGGDGQVVLRRRDHLDPAAVRADRARPEASMVTLLSSGVTAGSPLERKARHCTNRPPGEGLLPNRQRARRSTRPKRTTPSIRISPRSAPRSPAAARERPTGAGPARQGRERRPARRPSRGWERWPRPPADGRGPSGGRRTPP